MKTLEYTYFYYQKKERKQYTYFQPNDKKDIGKKVFTFSFSPKIDECAAFGKDPPQ